MSGSLVSHAGKNFDRKLHRSNVKLKLLIFVTPSHCITVNTSVEYINQDKYLVQETISGNELNTKSNFPTPM